MKVAGDDSDDDSTLRPPTKDDSKPSSKDVGDDSPPTKDVSKPSSKDVGDDSTEHGIFDAVLSNGNLLSLVMKNLQAMDIGICGPTSKKWNEIGDDELNNRIEDNNTILKCGWVKDEPYGYLYSRVLPKEIKFLQLAHLERKIEFNSMSGAGGVLESGTETTNKSRLFCFFSPPPETDLPDAAFGMSSVVMTGGNKYAIEVKIEEWKCTTCSTDWIRCGPVMSGISRVLFNEMEVFNPDIFFGITRPIPPLLNGRDGEPWFRSHFGKTSVYGGRRQDYERTWGISGFDFRLPLNYIDDRPFNVHNRQDDEVFNQLYHASWKMPESLNHVAWHFGNFQRHIVNGLGSMNRNYPEEMEDLHDEVDDPSVSYTDWRDILDNHRYEITGDNDTWRFELDFSDKNNGKLYLVSGNRSKRRWRWSVATEASDGGESNGGETKRYLLCQGLTGEYSWFAQIESEGVGIIDPGMNPLHDSNGTGIRVVRSMIMNEKNEWEEQK